MPTRLADRLASARRTRFVGRNGEIQVFQSALEQAEPPFQILYIYGPGGIGKTSLLREFAARAEQLGAAAFYVDGRNLEPTPESFQRALLTALGVSPDTDIDTLLGKMTQRHVLLLDTYEVWSGLDNWLRDEFLPKLPENTIVVMAGREPLSAGWQADPGWQMLVRQIALRNLSPEEGREFLERRDIPAEQHRSVLDFTHGYPLALSLVADLFDQRHDINFQPESAPDVIKILLERFVQKVPGPAHRAAFEASAMVRVLNESLLATMLKLPDPASELKPEDMAGAQSTHELLEWLRSLSYIEAGREGLFPHELARETVIADVRWRNPDWYKELHNRARKFYVARLPHVSLPEQQRILYDFIFLHRDNPIMRAMFDFHSDAVVLASAMHDQDKPALFQMIEKFEGEESVKWAKKWFARQPDKVTVYRNEKSEVIGLFAAVEMQAATEAELNADPATRATWNYLKKHAPLRPGEVGTHYRFWMAHDTYQGETAIQTQIFLTTVRYQILTPGLAYHFFPCANADFWAPALLYGDLTRIPEADYSVGAHKYGVYGHDWRVRSPLAWLDLLAQREVAPSPEDVAPPPETPLIVLSQTEFTSAVHEALRDFARPIRLRDNALTCARMVVERVGPAASPDTRMSALQELLKDVIEKPQVSPREAKLYRAVQYTYLKPAMTQEEAAEALDVPFSTYRRHLKAGLIRVVDLLWQKEIGAGSK
jgi:AAA ATPase domain